MKCIVSAFRIGVISFLLLMSTRELGENAFGQANKRVGKIFNEAATQELIRSLLVENNKEKAGIVLKGGANINVKIYLKELTGEDPTNQLFQAAQSGNREQLTAGLAAGGNPTVKLIPLGIGVPLITLAEFMKKAEPSTLLYYATGQGNHSLMEWLLKNGANVSTFTKGRPALHLAVAREDLRAMELLIRYGADVNQESSAYGDRPVHLAAGARNREVMEKLINHGADIHAQRMFGDKPIHIAAEIGFSPVIKLLIKQGADVYDEESESERRPLTRAAKAGNIEAILALTDHDIPDNVIETFVKNNPTEAIDFLSKHGFGLPPEDLPPKERKIGTRYSLEQIAHYYGHEHIVRLLEEHNKQNNKNLSHNYANRK
jgi:ankyrin repeat protein